MYWEPLHSYRENIGGHFEQELVSKLTGPLIEGTYSRETGTQPVPIICPLEFNFSTLHISANSTERTHIIIIQGISSLLTQICITGTSYKFYSGT